jgi:dTDP-4-dehydrorhamnose reductase
LRPAAPGRILVTGGSGQVGEALTRTLAATATQPGEVFAPARGELDLADPGSIRRAVRAFHPRWILNAAAYTAVDKAESEPELAHAINATATAVLAEEAGRLGAVLIHYSTDYVFDGAKPEPYVESDPTSPLNVYGRTKLAGERALAASGAAHLIFRTSWVYGATGHNFLRSILRVARERDHLRIVADQHGAPTWSLDLAQMTAHVVAHLERAAVRARSSLPEAALPLSGVYHASAAGDTTWHGFASQAIAHMQQLRPQLKFASVEPISTDEYPTSAKRPLNSRLNCAKLERVFGWSMPDWKHSLPLVLGELAR